MRRALLIVNPISGTLSKEGLPERVAEKLSHEGWELTTVLTERGGHARELAREAVARNLDAVIVAGGDGTVNEIGSALRDTGVAMGILPFGSGNGLARHLMTSIDIDHAIDVIAKSKIQDCDYGLVNDKPFFCTFGLGFDAKVSSEFASMSQRGLASYIRSVVQEYLTYSPTEYEISVSSNDEEEPEKVKAFLVAACNASQYGNNAFIAPTASILDGMLDISVIHAGNPLTRALAGVELFTGRLEHNILVQTLRTASATIRHLPGPGHIDGEPLMMPETIHIECRRGGIRLFTDPDRAPFRPFITPIESMRDDSAFLIKEGVKNTVKNIKQQIGKIF